MANLSLVMKVLNDNIIRPLCMFFTQMSGNIKYFENGRKNISFKTDDDNVLT